MKIEISDGGYKMVKRHKKGRTYVAVWHPEMTEKQILHDIVHGMPFHPYNEETGEIDWGSNLPALTFKI
jgi:hypothetical protein